MGQVVTDFISGRKFGLYPEGNQELIELLEDKEACFKYECYKPWQYKNKNTTKERVEWWIPMLISSTFIAGVNRYI